MRRCNQQFGRVVIRAMGVVLCSQLAISLAAAPPVPLSAKVTIPGAAVHSGPGDNYYLTDTLPEGEVVEVYRRRDDGWCAIRPPAESFSWVFATNIQLDDEGLAKVTKENAASRVGSRLSSNRDVVQVRLRKGETVKILGKDDQASESWYKIAPPAGEFRWIAANSLTFADAADTAKPVDGAVTRTSHDEPATTAPASKSWELTPPPLASTTEPPAPSKATASSPPVNAPATKPSTPAPATNTAIATAVNSNTTAASPNADVTPVASAAAVSPDTALQLNDLELRLSRMVAEPPATWNTEALQQSAEQLLAKTENAADREAVQTTLAKINRFGAIQRRSASVGGGIVTAAAASATPGAISPSTITSLPAVGQAGSTANAATGATGDFDAVGVLRPVVSRRPGAPQFALVDDRGQVVTFVTATPDVNLQPYLGRRVGVVGSRGYIPEFHRAHVTASRVSPLGDTTLR